MLKPGGFHHTVRDQVHQSNSQAKTTIIQPRTQYNARRVKNTRFNMETPLLNGVKTTAWPHKQPNLLYNQYLDYKLYKT